MQQGGVFWSHQDPFVKSRRVTDGSGQVTSVIELDPWGGATGRMWNAGQQPRWFTSYLRDGVGSDEAMHRRYNRYYSRFEQPDPYDGSYDLSDPQSFNRYSYAQNDPVNFVDPSGLFRLVVRQTPRLILGGGGRTGADMFLTEEMAGTEPDLGGGGGGQVAEPGKPSHSPRPLTNYCRKFADIVEKIANTSRSDGRFVSRLYSRFVARPGSPEYSEFKGRGFRQEFQDEGNSFNQARHFVGGLVVSFVGALPGTKMGHNE